MVDVQSLLRNVRVRYWGALVIIGLFISLAFGLLSHQYNEHEDRTVLLNIATQQRMLSQKITLYATYHLNNIHLVKVDSNITKTLNESALQMQKNQLQLNNALNDVNTDLSHRITVLYQGKKQLNTRVNQFTEQAIFLSHKLEKSSINIVEPFLTPDNVEHLLQDLDLAAQYLAQDTIALQHSIEQTKRYLWLSLLLMLVLIGLYVFRPMQQRLKLTWQQLHAQSHKVSDYRFAIDKHALVCLFDLDKKLMSVNKMFTELHDYETSNLVGQSLSVLLSSRHEQQFINDIYNTIGRGDVWRGNLCNKAKSGRFFWFNTTIVPLKDVQGKVESYMVLQNDITEQVATENFLRQFHVITADAAMSLSEKINAVLKQGKALYQLPLAIVSEISGDEYKVIYADTPNNEVEPGNIFELGNTYCYHTLMANKAISYHHAGESGIKEHPCYQKFGLESYIGAPIFVAGKRFGTINFSSPEKYPYPFKDSDIELTQLVAQWIGYELEHHEQQEYLAGQQQLMSQMSQLAHIGAWEFDLVKQEIVWSSMTKTIHEVEENYQPNLATAINFYKAGKSRDRITELVEQAITRGAPYHEELQLITAKGNEIWVTAKGEAEFEQGECVRLFGSFQDITKQKQIDLELQDKNRRMRLAADSAGIGIWEFDLVTEKVKWDALMYKLYGVNEQEYSGTYQVWQQMLHSDDRKSVVNAIQAAIKNGDKFDTQFRIVWPTGTIRYIKAAAMVVTNPLGEPVTMIGVNYDVTERVENELALTTAKLEAEAGARAKNEFLASISHEIRTPMNGVVGMLSLVKDTPLTNEQRQKIDIAESSATSLLHLINDILDFSKIDADRLELEEICFDLCSMIGKLAESFATQLETKGIELIVDTTDLPTQDVMGDPSRIRQVLTNLLSNSIKFTHVGEVIVTAKLTPDTQHTWLLELCVKDTGIGIAKDKQALLFEHFSQVDASTTREYGGTGLGLAIVKKLCQRMDGTVHVESELGQGSCFTCELRVGVVQHEAEHNSPLTSLAKRHVLIVDGNQTNANMMSRQLEQWQVNVTTASTLEQAWQCCISHLTHSSPFFDLVIVDSTMHADNEINFVELMAQHETLAAVDIVLMTPMLSKGWTQLLKHQNCVQSFSKPITMADFTALHACLLTPEHEQPLSYIDETVAPSINESSQRNIAISQPHKEIKTASSSTDNTREATLPWPKNSNVLLVEDNRVNQMVAKGVLTKIGLSCDIAVNGREALEMLNHKSNNFSLILMDIQMPEMDGYETTMRIRQGQAGALYKDIKIVAMTANAMHGDREKCLQAGMNDYLAKPINKDAVIEKLSYWLANEA